MDPKDSNPPTTPVRHEGGDPASLKEDPAQAYPTGGAGLVAGERQGRGDVGTPPPEPDRPRQGT